MRSQHTNLYWLNRPHSMMPSTLVMALEHLHDQRRCQLHLIAPHACTPQVQVDSLAR